MTVPVQRENQQFRPEHKTMLIYLLAVLADGVADILR